MRRLLLYVVLFGVCLGLGYPSLQRYDPSAAGLADVAHYRKMVRLDYAEVPAPFRFRVLVPTLAAAVDRATSTFDLGSWKREMLALLVVNAALAAATALMLIGLARAARLPAEAVVPLGLLYLSSFGVAQGHLAGLVDSAEAAVIGLALWLALRERWIWIALLLGASPLAKETALALASVLTLTVLIHERAALRPWIAWASGSAAGCGVLVLLRVAVGPGLPPSLPPATGALLARAADVLSSRSLVYTFAVIGPLGLVGLKRLPRPLVAGSVAAGLVALLGASWAGVGENAWRPLFSALGPALCLGSAVTYGRLVGAGTSGARKSP